MPGICGFLNTKPSSDSTSLIARMLTRLRIPECRINGQRTDPAGRFAIGRASTGVLPSAPQPVGSGGGSLHAVMDGELYDMDRLCGERGQIGERLHHDDYATALLARYESRGIEAISNLDGSFSAAIVDSAAQTLTLVSDRFGTRPLYYAQTPDRFLFSSSIYSLLADSEIPRKFDWQGLSQFFTFGHYFNDHTSLDAVSVLPAGAALVFSAYNNQISLKHYWSGSDRTAPRPTSKQDAYDAVDDALVSAVRARQSAGAAKVGLSLSGGLDARTILGTLDHRRNNLATLCMGMEGSCEHKVATELSRIIGCKHHNHVLDIAFLHKFGEHLEAMVRLTDGQYLSQCIVMPTLPIYQKLGIKVLLRGHAGEMLHMSKAYNYSLDGSALRLASQSALEDWLWPRITGYISGGVDGPLFIETSFSARDAARESLRQALAFTPPTETPADRISHLFLDQRVRRETMLSMRKFRSVTEPRLPYLDRVLVERLFAMPVAWRMGDELQHHILRKRQPLFCQVENTNTGAPLGAGTLRRQYARVTRRVFAKLGVAGYQPYERLGLWLRRDLAGVVRATLLNDRCLDRGIFHPDTMRRVVERHLSGERNHTYLVLALLVFEVGHRWLLEDESFAASNEHLHLATSP